MKTCHSCVFYGKYLNKDYCFVLNQINILELYNPSLNACFYYKQRGSDKDGIKN